MKKIILLCQQGVPLELSPARYQLICEFEKRNYAIYCFFPGKVTDGYIKSKIHRCINTKSLSIKKFREKIKSISPDIVIAFTYEDAKVLYPLMKTMRNTKFVYYNLEIYTPQMEEYIYADEKFFKVKSKAAFFLNKIKEIIFVHDCYLFVIQDALRAKISAKHFIHHSNTMLIPNTYIYNSNDDVGVTRKGIIYSGGLNKLQLQTLIGDIEKLSNIPITFSGWSDKWFKTQFKKIHELYPEIRLSEQSLSQEKFTQFLNQFAVGLIWYSPTGNDNIDYIGMSSGKLFKHLSLGQPVIVMSCPGLDSIVCKYKLGVVINDVSQIKEAYESIMRRYSFYRENVKYVYKRKFDYEKIIIPFLEELDKN